MSGLPASYIKKHNGNMKAAWADYRSAHKGGGKSSHPRRSSSSGEGGNPNATRPGGADLKTVVRSRVVSEIDPSTLGAIMYGMVQEAENPTQMDAEDVIPSVLGARVMTQQTAVVSDAKAAWLQRYREEILIGREAVRTGALGKVLLTLGIPSGKGAAHYAAAIRRANGQGGSFMASGGAFTPPFDVATAVTSPFGAQRAGGFHRGVDIAAAVGTPVHAPWAAKVQAVFTEDEGGNVVRLALQRPDGGYADDTTSDDDSGLLLSFLHLDRAAVKEGDIVRAGDVIAYSGNTGKSTGPHLHIMAELFTDRPWYGTDGNSRVMVDPAALYGGLDAIAGGGAPVPFAPDQVMGGIVIPRDGGAGAGPLGALGIGGGAGGAERATTLTITNRGALVIGGGTAVNTNVKAVLPLGEAFGGGGTGDGGLSNPPVPDALRGVAQQVLSKGGSILTGIGSLAGQVFGRFMTPQGLSTVMHLGGAAAKGAGSLAGLLGPAASLGGPLLAAIPYVGPFLAAAAEVAGPVASVLGPILSSAGSVADVASGILPGVFPGNAPQGIRPMPQDRTAGGQQLGPLMNIIPL